MRDEQTKRERGYKDKRSKVRPDGSEVLYGKDWTKRKLELWERCAGRCEACENAKNFRANHSVITRGFRTISPPHPSPP